MSSDLGITVSKKKDFSEWYLQVVLKGDLADYSSAKGFMILKPYGYAVWEKIRDTLDRELKKKGHWNAYFPSLIPEGLLGKEKEHFQGFTPEVFWVTQAGNEHLSERLAIRPTSETIIYEAYARWIRSWRDLPLLLNCWNSVLRAEIKSTKPFLRTSEFLWQEGHTVHASKEEADQEVMDILESYRRLVEEHLAIPVLTGLKSDKEKFVGALYTATLEALMPDGKVLQMGTSHNLGQNFSKAFEIRFLGKDKQLHFAWQTSWGVSWRLIGAVVMVHSDDKGLVMPPGVAPIQVVVVPILYSGRRTEEVVKKVNEVAELLTQNGISAHVDMREGYTPGWKFNDWELKGVPLRLEIGPRDVEGRVVTIVRRDNLQRSTVPDSEVVPSIRGVLDDIQASLYARAKKLLDEGVRGASTYEEFKKILEASEGFIKAGWCERRECEEALKEETGADIRLLPFGEDKTYSTCVRCGEEAQKVAYFGRAY